MKYLVKDQASKYCGQVFNSVAGVYHQGHQVGVTLNTGPESKDDYEATKGFLFEQISKVDTLGYTRDLYILEGHEEKSGVVTFDGESKFKKLYNVQFAISDFEAYFEVENIDLDQFEDLHHHAQEIYDTWEKGGTYYEVSVSVK